MRPRACMEVRVTTNRLRRRENGQTMTEYAVVLGIITPIVVLAYAALSDSIIDRLETFVGYFS